MRELLIWYVVLLAAVSSVQSNAIYRKYREIEIPVENLQQQEAVQEVIGELRKEVIPVEVDVIEPVVVLKEEVIVPVETVRNAEPASETDENAPVINEIIPKNIQDELPSENDLLEKVDEKQPEIELVAQPENSEGEPNLDEDNALPGLKQSSNTTVRPTLLQQAQQSFGQFIDTFRRPLTGATGTSGSPGDAGAETSTNPNLLQQFQASVQNIGNQITNALIPNQNLDGGASTPRPPNILENLQTNFQNVVSNVFRPPTEPSNAGVNPTPVGPLQAVISNVQSFFTGNRGGEQSPQGNKPEAATQDPNKPVAEKVDQNVRNSEEIRDSSENTQQDIVVGEPDDSSE